MITIILSKALLCVPHVGCYSVLVGNDTPTGVYKMEHVIVDDGKKRMDVLKIADSRPGRIVAIHRAINDHRRALIRERSTTRVTLGCINVADDVFDYLVEVHAGREVSIVP